MSTWKEIKDPRPVLEQLRDKWRANVEQSIYAEEELLKKEATDIRNDLTEGKGRPNWILSAYGPGKEQPATLLKELEWSPEELRVAFYAEAAQGREVEANQKATDTWNEAIQKIQNVSSEANGVPSAMRQAGELHPNRIDLCKITGQETVEQFSKNFASPSNVFASTAGAFGSNPPSAAPPFGGRFGQPTSGSGAFGQPAFGSTGFGQSKPNPFAPASAAAGFGQSSSTFGQSSQPAAFGQATQLSSTFGQPTQPSPFSQPSQQQSVFGQPNQQSSAFSQPTSTFSQPSQPAPVFGQRSQPAPAFGLPTQPVPTFGQPSQQPSPFDQKPSPFGQQPSPFGQQPSPFGQKPSPLGQQPSPFGQQPSPLDQSSQQASQSRQPSQSSNVFGQPAQPTNFGQTSTGFGQTPLAPSRLGQTTFGSGTIASGANIRNPFGSQNIPSAPGSPRPQSAGRAGSIPESSLRPQPRSSSDVHPLTNAQSAALTYTQTLPTVPSEKDADGQLISYRGQKVDYRLKAPDEEALAMQKKFGEMNMQQRAQVAGVVSKNVTKPHPFYHRPDGKGLEKIWFPEGEDEKDVRSLNAPEKRSDLEAEPEAYTDEVKEQYEYLHRTGTFKDGKMPSVPPMREWIDYDF